MRFARFAFAFALGTMSLSLAFSDSFTNTSSNKSFYLTGVPSYDQRRMETTVTIGDSSALVLGLSNNGSEFCLPTSGIDWTSFLANRGYPNLLPTAGYWGGSWTDGITGLGQYNVVDLSIAFMAADMGTDPTNGTYGGPAQTGMQQFLDSEYLGQFNTVNIEADNSGYPRILDMVKATLNGNLIETYGGWYNSVQYNGSTYLYRNGGHVTAMAAGSWTSSSSAVSLQLCNPWTYDDMTVQSPFTYSPFTTEADDVAFTQVDSNGNAVAGTQVSYNCDYLDKSSNWIFDGALEIQPIHGYTIHHNWIWYLIPIQFINLQSYVYKQITSFDGSDILSVTEDALSGDLFYVTTDSNAIFRVSPLTGETTRIPTRFHPRQVLFGAERQPYVLFGDGSVAQYDLDGRTLLNERGLGNIDKLVYDPYLNAVGAIDDERNVMNLLDKNLGELLPAVQLPAVQLTGGNRSFDFGPFNQLRVVQQGVPYVYGVSLLVSATGNPTRMLLPAVQNADTFALDDMGNFYLSVNGALQVYSHTGKLISSPFTGLPAGDTLNISRNVSNFDPTIHATSAWRNYVPPGAFQQNNN